jgi:hypothetical protein
MMRTKKKKITAAAAKAETVSLIERPRSIVAGVLLYAGRIGLLVSCQC